MCSRPDGDARAVERIDDASEADQRVLDHLARLGCDPSSPRETRHYLYVAARVDADALAAALAGGGWLTAVEPSDEDWLVVASRRCALTPASVRQTRTQLERLVGEYRGLYDGWEAMLS